MRALKDWEFDPAKPVQTRRGAAQALRCGADKVDGLIEAGVLKTVDLDRIRRITTASIMAIVNGERAEVA
jgi:hypothetical protein